MQRQGCLKKHAGFTLIELVIAVAIVAILAAIAIPSYQAHAMKARRSDGQAFLLNIQSRMERHMFDNEVYPSSLAELNGFTTATVLSPEKFYEVSIKAADAACPVGTCYVLEAKALGPQVDDGDLTLDSKGNKGGKWH